MNDAASACPDADRLIAGLPDAVRVGPFDILILKINPTEAAALRRYGEFSSIEQVLRIQYGFSSKLKCCDTLIHEILHAIWWAYGIEDADKEEREVGMLSTAMVQVYRDNPWLLKFIETAMA